MNSHKQHYVPNFILRNFASCDGVLWIINKETGDCWSRTGGKQNRLNDFVENKYLPSRVDQAISLNESNAAPIIKQILIMARKGVAPSLTRTDKKKLCKYLYNQILRAPRVREHGENIHSGLYHSMLEDNPDAVLDNEYPERELFHAMVWMDLESAVIPKHINSHLVVSDEPCWHSEEIVVMRIAKDAFIQLGNFNRGVSFVHAIEPDFVDELNLESMKKAHRFVAGPDQAVLQALFNDLS